MQQPPVEPLDAAHSMPVEQLVVLKRSSTAPQGEPEAALLPEAESRDELAVQRLPARSVVLAVQREPPASQPQAEQ